MLRDEDKSFAKKHSFVYTSTVGGQCGLDKRDRNKIEECIPFNSDTLLNYASVNSSSAHPPPPRATPGHFLMLPVPGWGICVPRVDPRAFDTWFRNRGVSRVFVMEAFIGQDVDYVAD